MPSIDKRVIAVYSIGIDVAVGRVVPAAYNVQQAMNYTSRYPTSGQREIGQFEPLFRIGVIAFHITK